MIGDVAIGPSYWFFNGARVLNQADGNGNPFSRISSIPSPLIIPSFGNSHVGKYGCGPFSNFDGGSSQVDTITLSLSGT